MRSLRSHLILFLLKNRHWFNGKLRRPIITFETSIEAQRQSVEDGASRFGKIPQELSITPSEIASRYVEWIRPSGDAPRACILYFHGGGYVMGSARSHRAIVSKFVERSGLSACVFDYRLAPEHPFPAAVEDALAVYRALLKTGSPEDRIVFAGDSAGGGLALGTLLRPSPQSSDCHPPPPCSRPGPTSLSAEPATNAPTPWRRMDPGKCTRPTTPTTRIAATR